MNDKTTSVDQKTHDHKTEVATPAKSDLDVCVVKTAYEPKGHVESPAATEIDSVLEKPGDLIAGRWLIRDAKTLPTNRPKDAPPGSLGQGGIATVWEAVDTKGAREGKRVALKIARPSGADFALAQIRKELLEEEARLLSRLDCDNVVRCTDVETTDDGRMAIVLEYLDGPTLYHLRHQQPERRLPQAEALNYVIQAIWGLQAAHSEAILHRDLSPRNIVVTQRADGPTVKLIDFNAGKRLLPGKVAHTGIGTAGYKAPELSRSVVAPRYATPQSDQWSLAAVAVECLTGFPFESTAEEVVKKAGTQLAVIDILRTLAPKESPDELLNVLARALDDTPDARFPDVLAFGAALLPFADSDTQRQWHRRMTTPPIPIQPQVTGSILIPQNKPPSRDVTESPVGTPRPSSIVTTPPQGQQPKARMRAAVAVPAVVLLFCAGAFAWRAVQIPKAPSAPPPAWITETARPVAKPAVNAQPVTPEPAVSPAAPVAASRPSTVEVAPSTPPPAAAPPARRARPHPKPVESKQPLVDEKGIPILMP